MKESASNRPKILARKDLDKRGADLDGELNHKGHKEHEEAEERTVIFTTDCLSVGAWPGSGTPDPIGIKLS